VQSGEREAPPPHFVRTHYAIPAHTTFLLRRKRYSTCLPSWDMFSLCSRAPLVRAAFSHNLPRARAPHTAAALGSVCQTGVPHAHMPSAPSLIITRTGKPSTAVPQQAAVRLGGLTCCTQNRHWHGATRLRALHFFLWLRLIISFCTDPPPPRTPLPPRTALDCHLDAAALRHRAHTHARLPSCLPGATRLHALPRRPLPLSIRTDIPRRASVARRRFALP